MSKSYLIGLKTGVQIKTYTQIFIVALFTIAKGGNNPSDEWINKMEYYLALTRNEVLICATICMNIEKIVM